MAHCTVSLKGHDHRLCPSSVQSSPGSSPNHTRTLNLACMHHSFLPMPPRVFVYIHVCALVCAGGQGWHVHVHNHGMPLLSACQRLGDVGCGLF